MTGTTFTDTDRGQRHDYYYAVRAVDGGVRVAPTRWSSRPRRARSVLDRQRGRRRELLPGHSELEARERHDAGAPGGIEGFATATSIDKGESVDLKVNADRRLDATASRSTAPATTAATRAACSRRSRRSPACRSRPASQRHDDRADRLLQLVGRPRRSRRRARGRPASTCCASSARTTAPTTTSCSPSATTRATSDVLYGAADTTYQAYNNYGGRSLYDFNSSGGDDRRGTPRAVKVSFDRPYEQPLDRASATGTRATTSRLVSWLEQPGLRRHLRLERRPRAQRRRWSGPQRVHLAGHDEYWSPAMRSALEQARDAGVDSSSRRQRGLLEDPLRASPASGATDRVHGLLQDDPERRRPTRAASRRAPGATRPARTSPRTRCSARCTSATTTSATSRCGSPPPRARTASGATPASTRSRRARSRTSARARRLGVGRARRQRPRARRREDARQLARHRQPDPGQRRVLRRPARPTVHVDQVHGAERRAGLRHRHEPLEPRPRAATSPARASRTSASSRRRRTSSPTWARCRRRRPPTSSSTAARAPCRGPTGVDAHDAGQRLVRVSVERRRRRQRLQRLPHAVPRDGGQPLGARVNSSSSPARASPTPAYPATDLLLRRHRGRGGVQTVASERGRRHDLAVRRRADADQRRRPGLHGALRHDLARRHVLHRRGTLSVTEPSITGTTDPALYQDERWGQFSYAIPVADGTYDVRFHFAELYYGTAVAGGPGKRVFGMDIATRPPTS